MGIQKLPLTSCEADCVREKVMGTVNFLEKDEIERMVDFILFLC